MIIVLWLCNMIWELCYWIVQQDVRKWNGVSSRSYFRSSTNVQSIVSDLNSIDYSHKSFSRCYIQQNQWLQFSFQPISVGEESGKDIGGSSKSHQNEDGREVWKMWTIDEILILQLLLILGEDSIIETIVTLTSEGVLTSTNNQGEIQWSKSIHLQWSEFDEKSVYIEAWSCPCTAEVKQAPHLLIYHLYLSNRFTTVYGLLREWTMWVIPIIS